MSKESFEKNLKHLVDLKICENFELIDHIGTGNKSEVFRAKLKQSTSSIIAIKIIKKGKEQKNYLNTIIDFFKQFEDKERGLYYNSIEYAKYGDLLDFPKSALKNNLFTEGLLCFLSYQILNGLKYMHSKIIAHFGLKPNKLLIDEYLNIKLIDFSSALDYSKLNSDKITLPSRAINCYIQPEIIKNKNIKIKDLNKIDLYSLGLILHQLAFNNEPFELVYAKGNEKITKNYYSSYFIDFLKKLLEKDINQ